MRAADRPAVGREDELAAAVEFLDAIAAGPAALLIEGDAGIGKTTVWRAAVTAAIARGHRVLSATAIDVEADLPFVTLRDLLDDVPAEDTAALPAVQRRALEVALFRVAGPVGDQQTGQHAVSVAVLGVVRSLAAQRPLVIAVDDVGWIDPSSERVLSYVIRRLTTEPVGVLVARRPTGLPSDPLGLSASPLRDRLHRMTLAPLSADQMQTLLTETAGLPLPLRLGRAVHRAAAGNPFYGLEIARAVTRAGMRVLDEDAPPLPGGLQTVTARRVAALRGPARRALAVAAALRSPTVALITEVVGPDTVDAIEEAAAEGLLTITTDGVTFPHPLLRTAAAATLTPAERAELHRSLAAAVDDPDERAAHLAAGATAPDEAIALALDDAAARAMARGAPDAAAVLADRAAALTPPDSPRLADRTVRTGEYRYRAEDVAGAAAVLVDVLDRLPACELRAEALLWLCYVRQAQNSMADVVGLGTRALADDPAPPLRAAIERDLAYAHVIEGDPVTADRFATAALATANADGDPVSIGESEATCAWTRFWTGHGLHPELLAATRARTSWTRFTPQGAGPNAVAAMLLTWSDRIAEGRAALQAEDARLVELGHDRPRLLMLFTLAELACRTGDWDEALGLAQEGLRLAELTGDVFYGALVRYAHGLVRAHRGHLAEATADARQVLAASREGGAAVAGRFGAALLGFIALSTGDHDGAHAHLGPLVAALPATYDPGLARFVPDDVEALARLGDRARAEAVLGPFEAQAVALDRPWALAAGARCRALLASAAGEQNGALDAVATALAAHERVPMPFERARTLLVAGSVRRRARRTGEARTTLEEALAEFERLGASTWAAQARDELQRIGGRTASAPASTPASTPVLTEAERRIAELVTAGYSNREVATTLFLTVATVESTLWKIYRKLDVRSRAELAARLAPGT